MKKGEYKTLLIGEIRKNNKGLEFEIIDYVKGEDKRKIRFLKTGFETEVDRANILRGSVNDLLSPSIYGVGCLGYKHATLHPIYRRWSDMLRRCYSEKCTDFKTYGGRGVYVSEDWLNFENYKNDMEKKENYDKLIKDPKNWHIDKDLSGKNYYSNETTQIIRSVDNLKESNKRSRINKIRKINMYDLEGKFIRTYDSIIDCSKEYNIDTSCISRCCRGKQKTAGGYTFSYFE